ncbi:PLA2G15 (predicted) [Pycnogonum litorale]
MILKVALLLLLLTALNEVTDARNPFVLVPGFGGSRLIAKLDKTKSPHVWCEKKTSSYYTLWLNVEELLPLSILCFVDNMKLYYNKTTKKTFNTPGVDILVPGFGRTETIEYLDEDRLITPGHYYSELVSSLISRGYERGKDIFGAPYDFRRAPNELECLFTKLKMMIENAYNEQGQLKVVLVGHSFGTMNLLYFLNRQTQEWKDKYIKTFISISGPFAGSVKAVKTVMSGDDLGIPIENPLNWKEVERTFPSMAFFLPSTKYWDKSETIVSISDRNYNSHELKELFEDINLETVYEMWNNTKDLIYDLTPPGVEVHCIYALGVKTVERFVLRR